MTLFRPYPRGGRILDRIAQALPILAYGAATSLLTAECVTAPTILLDFITGLVGTFLGYLLSRGPLSYNFLASSQWLAGLVRRQATPQDYEQIRQEISDQLTALLINDPGRFSGKITRIFIITDISYISGIVEPDILEPKIRAHIAATTETGSVLLKSSIPFEDVLRSFAGPKSLRRYIDTAAITLPLLFVGSFSTRDFEQFLHNGRLLSSPDVMASKEVSDLSAHEKLALLEKYPSSTIDPHLEAVLQAGTSSRRSAYSRRPTVRAFRRTT